MKCVQVLKKDAEKVKRFLMEMNMLALDYLPFTGRKYVYFPVIKTLSGYTYVQRKVLRSQKKTFPIGAYDQVGDIVIVPEETKKDVALQLLQKKDVRVILRKKGIHHGEFRTQDLEWLAGEKRKETMYKEFGLEMKLDVEKCYFSPRLGFERMRIAKLIRPREKVLVLFSGVGPYPLVLAKYSKASLIVGVEKNILAHRYAMENCRKYSQIVLYNKDVRSFHYPEKFDRILMPLPKSAEEFLDFAVEHLKKKGMIHFYTFARAKEIPERPVALIKEKVSSFKVVSVVKCGQYAPQRYRVCVDFRL